MAKLKITQHEIKDNLIMVNNRETVLLGADKVIVGVDSGETEIRTVTDSEGNKFNYETKKIDAQVIYDRSKIKHSSWFVLDLETGTRGWYPGKESE